VTVYQPRLFVQHDAQAALRVINEYPFATLIAPGGDEPQISHLPLLHHSGLAPHGILVGHMAKANPHWQRFGEAPALAIFQGPHAYVSPSWYGEPATAVPTWNYAVVHVRGRVELIESGEPTLAAVQELVARFEADRAEPWQLQLQGERLDAMLNAIVAFRIVIERIDAKFKMSQNRIPSDRERVIAALEKEPYPESVATAAWMARYVKQR
jgi:transcriptional regulator